MKDVNSIDSTYTPATEIRQLNARARRVAEIGTEARVPSSKPLGLQVLLARAEPAQQMTRHGVRKFPEHVISGRARGLDQPSIVFETREAQHRLARLARAQKLARAT